MDFKDQIKQLSERIANLKEQIQTEEATKTAFIMPFIQSLGYDIFNPMEVVPEFTCDIGTKKGEKIDYAILKEGEPIILIECKHWSKDLTLHDNQLLRYFHVSKAKFGVLTNGIIYRFYTDLETANKMDEKPFLEVDLLNVKDNYIEELKKFHNSYFDIGKILDTAEELKYTSAIKALIQNDFQSPSEAFTCLFAKQIYNGRLNQKMIDYFSKITKKSFSMFISDIISERLQNALNNEQSETPEEQEETPLDTERQIITTDDEKEAFYTIKTLLIDHIEPERVMYKDTLTYFAINIDNTKKPLCRLYFNSKQHYISLFDEEKKETKYPVNSIYDIIKYKQHLIDRVNALK
jgi:hypothetical protein